MSVFSFTVAIAGIGINFTAPRHMEVPPELKPFLTNSVPIQETYEIELIDRPLVFENKPVFSSCRLAVYANEDGVTRAFLPLQAPDGCIPACRMRRNGINTLYIPANDWQRYERKCTLSTLLGPETLFLRHNGLILHSSIVRYSGQAVLFCGPSGVGKSTQAELWERYRNGEILNGDRCVIMKRGDTFFGCGSPYSGSSGVYKQEEAPIRAIILPEKSLENRIERIEQGKAFRQLYRELIGNLWDEAFTGKLLELLHELVLHVPVYHLYCRPEEQAVELTHDAVFGGQ